MTLKASQKQNFGQYFTSTSITEFMVNLVMEEFKEENKLDDFIVLNLSLLEPAAGDGAFLETLIEYGFKNITAFEIDKYYYNMLKNKFGNNIKLKNSNFLESSEEEKYDLIIGNPPYLGQNYASEIFQGYIRKYPICKEFFCGNMDLFYWFLHLGIRKLRPGGLLCFITTNYWIKKGEKTGVAKLKPHIIEECFLKTYVDLSNLKVFKDAPGQDNCIFILQKKNNEEKTNKIDKKIKIIQFKNSSKFQDCNSIFQSADLNCISYDSAITNQNLKKNGSWNLLFPWEVKVIIDKIENTCKNESGKVIYLKDFFQIRNGIISIKDRIFILKENEDIIRKNGDFFLKIEKDHLKLNEFEKNRLKKIYKGRAIRPYGFIEDDYLGWMIFFDKIEFQSDNFNPDKKYPVLMRYLYQFEDELKNTLIKCKESPRNWLFPRRGFKIHNLRNKSGIEYLEPYYENQKKIFFSYISKENVFGFARVPFYATSDTYFLHNDGKKADYLFLIAYLNSKLMKFIFYAKGLEIKRSKSKLENEIPIISYENLKTQEKRDIYKIIRKLSKELITNSLQDLGKIELYKRDIDKLIFTLFDLNEKIIDSLISKYYSN